MPPSGIAAELGGHPTPARVSSHMRRVSTQVRLQLRKELTAHFNPVTGIASSQRRRGGAEGSRLQWPGQYG